MSFSLEFKVSALKEWKKLDGGIREQLKKNLAERLDGPRVWQFSKRQGSG